MHNKEMLLFQPKNIISAVYSWNRLISARLAISLCALQLILLFLQLDFATIFVIPLALNTARIFALNRTTGTNEDVIDRRSHGFLNERLTVVLCLFFASGQKHPE